MSDSEYSSSSSSSSESDSDLEMDDLLSSIGMKKKYSRIFSKAKVYDIEDAKELTEKQLKRMGIGSSSDRKKIMQAIEEATSSDDSSSDSYDSESDSDSSEDDLSDFEKLQKFLKSAGLKKYSKILKQNRVTSISAAKKLDDRKLKKFGISSSSERRTVLKGLSGSRRKADSSSDSNSDFNEVADALEGAGLKKYSKQVKKAKVKSMKDAKKLDDKTLKRAGIESEKVRSKIIKTLNPSRKKKSSSKNEREIIVRILKQSKLQEYVKVFDKKGIDTLKKASALSPANLREMGILTLTARSRLISKFSNALDHLHGENLNSSTSDEEDDIRKALKRCKQTKYLKNFKERNINSVRQAQELKHAELKDLGIENQGIRTIIMEAFADADWKCTYCQAWNAHRKTCESCHKVKRIISSDAKFELQQSVKYIGKFRPTTRVKYGDKGKIHRVLADEFYMVSISQKDKTVKIRLPGSDLKAC